MCVWPIDQELLGVGMPFQTTGRKRAAQCVTSRRVPECFGARRKESAGLMRNLLRGRDNGPKYPNLSVTIQIACILFAGKKKARSILPVCEHF